MIKQTSSNPLANLLVVAAGVIVIGVSIVLGFFAFVVLVAIVAVAAAVLSLRTWWYNRKSGGQSGQSGQDRKTPGVIEGEYQVIEKDRDEA